ncbi:MAG: class B sortase [Eubacteriales bacterium]
MKEAKKKKKNIILNVIIIIAVIGALISGYMIYTDVSEYQEGDNVYKDIASDYVTITDENQDSETQSPEPSQSADNDGEDGNGSSGSSGSSSKYVVDFNKLKKINSDIIAWIINDGTVINYPIVQGDDNTYYLTHLPNGTKNKLGSLFMDYRNSSDFSMRNTIIYGHHMKSGAMFASIVNYKKQSYYDKHPTMYLITPDTKYRIDLFSGYVSSVDEDSFTINFIDDYAFETFVKERKEKSDFESDVQVTASDRIITLATCTYEFSNARYVLYGKLTPIDSLS